MATVFIGEGDHLGIFFLQLGEVGIECFDGALACLDFLIEDGNLFVVGLDEFLALLDFLVQEVDLIQGHLFVFGGLFQQLVGGRDFVLQGGDFALQLLLRFAFGLLGVGGGESDYQDEETNYELYL